MNLEKLKDQPLFSQAISKKDIDPRPMNVNGWVRNHLVQLAGNSDITPIITYISPITKPILHLYIEYKIHISYTQCLTAICRRFLEKFEPRHGSQPHLGSAFQQAKSPFSGPEAASSYNT